MERLRVIGRRLVERVEVPWIAGPGWSAVDAILAGAVAGIVAAVAGAMMGGAGEKPDARLIRAIEMVESSGGQNLYGDYGGDDDGDGVKDLEEYDAWGWLQIQPIMVAEVNRIAKLQKLGERFTLADRLDREKSHRMFRVYVSQHAQGATDEQKARRWNGGPDGDTKKATEGYWAKVRTHLHAGGAK